MKKPKVIVADIDNTLVPKHQDISEYTAKTIIRCQKQGIYFGIASGRPTNELASLIKKWGTFGIKNDLIIASNGAVLVDNIQNKRHEQYFMTPKQIKETIELMKPFNLNIGVSIDEESWSAYEDEFVIRAKEYLGIDMKYCNSDDYHELYQKPVGKIIFRLDDESKMPEIEEYVKDRCPKGLIGFKTNSIAFEFTDERVNKGVALVEFCKNNNIAIEESWAFGDTSNDNEMLKVAGTGVCLLNGTDDTKACADYITEYDVENEGFSKFIEKYLFGEGTWN